MTSSQPHILFIVLDTLRRDRLGVYGYARPTSPQLDAFAAQSTRFERAVAAAQWTVPSHASMFTGVYPTSHQVTQSSSRLAATFATAAELLRFHGYHTVAFCNNPLVGVLDHDLQRGFAEFYNYASAVPQRPNEAQRSQLYRAFMRRFRPFAREVGNQFARHDWLFRLALHPLWVPIWSKYINFKGSTANSIADVIDYWGAYLAGGAERPLFLFLNLMQPHLPYQPPQGFLDRIAPELRGDRRAYQFIGRFNADGAAWASPPPEPYTDWQRQAFDAFYDAEIAYQDELLGRLLAYLETSGALANTFVVITADHGEGLGEHDLFGHGFATHQELVHVPLLLRGADRVPVGGLVTDSVSTRRIFHTLLDVAGAGHSDARELSLLRTVRGDDPEGGIAYAEAVPPTTFLHVLEHRDPASIERLRLSLTWRAVHTGRHKLMTAGDAPVALYDLAADPAETRNLIDQEPELTALLAQQLERFVQTVENGRTGAAEHREMSDEVLEHLRALGYVDE